MRNKNQGQLQNSGISRFKKIKLRTMDSDKKSIQNQGGGEPKPYSPNQANETVSPKKPMEYGQQSNQSAFPISEPSQNQQPKPPSPEGQPFQKFPPTEEEQDSGGFPPKPSPMPGSGGQEPPKKGGGVKPLGPEKLANKNKNKKIFVGLLIAIIVIGILVAGYFFVLPMLTGGDASDESPATEPLDQQPPLTEEGGENFNVPTVPVERGDEATSTGDEATTTEPEETSTEPEEIQASNEIPVDSHVSLFSTPADSTVEKVVSSMDLAGIKSALEISPTEVPLFREVVLTDGEENIIRTEEVLSILAPSVFTEDVLQNFGNDSTVFTFTDDSGTWVGIAVSASSGADLSQVKTQTAELENNVTEVKNFFLSDPGTETSWKDGGVGDISSRYLSFSNEGTSFNYGWSGNILLIATSYPAFQKAVGQL